MIELPDGTKRLPTKEEILDGIRSRKQQSLSGNSNSSKTAIGTDSYTNRKNQYNDQQRYGTPFQFERRNRIDESDAGSRSVSDGRIRSEIGQTRRNNGSIDEYNERPTTSYTESDPAANTTSFSIPIQQQVKTSLFSPYKKAFKDAFSKKPTSKAKPKVVPQKVLSEVEAKNIRDDLIKIILIQSENADSFIIATTKGHDKSIIIWSDIDRKDATIIADFMLSRARKDPKAARIVRQLMELNERIQLAEIIIPRAYRTMITYIEKGLSIR